MIKLGVMHRTPVKIPIDSTKNCLTGGVISRDKRIFKNGRLEVRAKLSYHLGSWQAIWMRSSDEIQNSSELDLMEYIHIWRW